MNELLTEGGSGRSNLVKAREVQRIRRFAQFNVSFPSQVTNIDGVLENHNDFLDRCLKDCMLTNPELLKVK